MNTGLLILLRLLHIVAGTLWVGAGVFYIFFIKPSVKGLAAAGPQFMQQLVTRRKYPAFMSSMSLITILAGGALYLILSGGDVLVYINTGPGIGFTIGALAGLLAFLVGNFGIGPLSGRMGALGQQISAHSGPPPTGLIDQLHALEKQLARTERVNLVLLTVAILTMATARYWNF